MAFYFASNKSTTLPKLATFIFDIQKPTAQRKKSLDRPIIKKLNAFMAQFLSCWHHVFSKKLRVKKLILR
jgi:hypothetical protein